MNAPLDPRDEYAVRFAEVQADALAALMDLVVQYGNGELKAKMWAVVDASREESKAALAKLRASSPAVDAPAGGAR